MCIRNLTQFISLSNEMSLCRLQFNMCKVTSDLDLYLVIVKQDIARVRYAKGGNTGYGVVAIGGITATDWKKTKDL